MSDILIRFAPPVVSLVVVAYAVYLAFFAKIKFPGVDVVNRTLFFGLCLLFLNTWQIFYIYIFAFLYVVSLARCFKRNHVENTYRLRLLDIGNWMLYAMIFCAYLYELTPYNAHLPVVDLAPPIMAEKISILKTGRTLLFNHHLVVHEQQFAIDMMTPHDKTFVTSSISGDPSQVSGYGSKIISPCDGTISEARDGIEDSTLGVLKKEYFEGNYLMIQCNPSQASPAQEFEVLLAHLKKESLQVAVGDKVQKGIYLGNLGNSGHTTSPHLHIHARTYDPTTQSYHPIRMTFRGITYRPLDTIKTLTRKNFYEN